MTTSSAAPARWREKTRIVVVDLWLTAIVFLFGSMVATAPIASYVRAPPTARAVAAMVREDTREALTVLEWNAVPAVPDFGMDIQPPRVNSFVFDVDGKRVMEIDRHGNLFITGRVYERGEKQ